MSHVLLSCICTVHRAVSQDAEYYHDKKTVSIEGFFIYKIVKPT